jgi:DDE superfamily endonuclease
MNNANFYPYFKDCIGAIDRSHIPAFVPKSKCMPFHNCKGQISQNILAACSFNFKFVYVLSGWKGSTSDSLVYQDTRSTDFHIPKGKYYLVDSCYLNTDALLAPYWSVCYHLKEWGNNRERCDSILSSEHHINDYRPQNHQELFNLRHAQLRNVIECIFGILKR